MSLSRPKLEALLNKPITPQYGRLSYHPILVADSKGFALQNLYCESNLEFLCKPGACSGTGVDILRANLPQLVKKSASNLIYFWCGTCDISVKSRKLIDLRAWDDSTIEKVIKEYRRAIDIVQATQNCKIKFIEIPVYSVARYN